jgi:trans-aconitate 2-methyltransferase
MTPSDRTSGRRRRRYNSPPMPPDTWQPETYARFATERSRPFHDLLDLVAPIPGGRAVDLGCGTGELTRELHRRTETVGIDSSDAMLGKAAAFAGDGLRFERGDIAAFAPTESFDLVFSNAAYHWVPDHPALLERLTHVVRPGGQLAFQVPDNFDHPSHRAAERAASEEPFRSALRGSAHPRNVLSPERYAEILARLGYTQQTVRLQVYGHRLDSREGVVAWVEGSLLSEYRRGLPAPLYDSFVRRYREILFEMIADERPYFFTFRRILAQGRR